MQPISKSTGIKSYFNSGRQPEPKFRNTLCTIKLRLTEFGGHRLVRKPFKELIYATNILNRFKLYQIYNGHSEKTESMT